MRWVLAQTAEKPRFPKLKMLFQLLIISPIRPEHHQHDTDKDTRSFQLEQLINNFQTIYHQIYLPCPYLLPTLNYFSKRKLSPTREQCF